MAQVEAKLAELGYELPPPPDPAGNYLPITRSGNIMWLAGVGSRLATGERIAGKLGADLTLEQGQEAARWAALNLLSRMKAELGDLDRVNPHPESGGNGQQRPHLHRAGRSGGRRVRPVHSPLRRAGLARPLRPGHGSYARQHRHRL